MGKMEAGRVIVVFPYKSQTTGKTYGSILLTLERANGCYMLPGGQLKEGETPEQAAAREVFEELGLQVDSRDLTLIYIYDGQLITHHVYLLAKGNPGTISLNLDEVMGLGFFNCGAHNKVPKQLLGSVVSVGLGMHLNNLANKGWFSILRDPSRVISNPFNFPKIEIPAKYFVRRGVDPHLIPWQEQQALWDKHGEDVFRREDILGRYGLTKERPR